MNRPWGKELEDAPAPIPAQQAKPPSPRQPLDIRQMATPCPACGQSWWTRDGHCNHKSCGHDRRRDIDRELRRERLSRFDRTTHRNTGQHWDSKQHKYVF